MERRSCLASCAEVYSLISDDGAGACVLGSDEFMKELYIRDLKKDNEFTSFFMVKGVTAKSDRNGKTYFDFIIGDNTGELPAKKWNVADEEYPNLSKIKEKDIIKLRGQMTEFNGQLQVRVVQIRQAVDTDGIAMDDFVKTAPENPKDMLAFVIATVEGFKDDELKRLCLTMIKNNEEKLLYYPAAQKNHHAMLGGLLYHIKRMILTGQALCGVYTNLNADLVITGVILHDLEKISEMASGTDGIVSGYTFEGQLLGHIIQGIKSIDSVSLELGISREKAIMVEHMILSHHYEPEFGSPKKPVFPEAELLHYLDMVDARMYDMDNALTATEPGSFSDRIWTLDNRKIYKPSFAE